MSAGALNYLLYQLGWFACVLGAAWGWPGLGATLGLLPIAAHVALTMQRADAVALVLWTSAIGLGVDTFQIALGTLRFDAGVVLPRLPPPWLVIVWAQFAITFHFGLRRLVGRPWAAALFGILGGPLAFLAGERLGVVTLHPAVWPSVASLAVTWAAAMPAAVWLAARQRGRAGVDAYRWPGPR